jgi:hypothetical protein
VSNMALTVTQKGRTNVTGNRLSVTLAITFDSSYPTGGEALDLTTYVSNIESVHIETTGTMSFVYDSANKKLKAFGPVAITDSDTSANANNLGGELSGTVSEVANATNLSSVSTTLVVSGGRA